MKNSFDPVDIIKIIIFIILVAGIAGVFVYMHVLNDPHEHLDSAWIVEVKATCTEQGYRYKTCPDCKAHHSGEVVPALGHDAKEPVKENVVEASCIAGGSYDEISYCSRCNEVVTTKHVIVEIHAHKAAPAVKENVIAPTCTEAGSYDSVIDCSECGARISSEKVTVPALGHTETEFSTEVVDPTCDTDGAINVSSHCNVCGEEYIVSTEVITAIGHTPSTAVKTNEIPSTCIAAGSYDFVIYCQTCGDELDRTTVPVPKLEHIPGAPVKENVVDPTCTKYGQHDNVIYCTAEGCGAVLSSTVGVSAPTGRHVYDATLAYNEVTERIELSIRCTYDGCDVTDVIDTFADDELVSEVTVSPTCATTGLRVYTATVDYDGYTLTASTTVVEPTEEHVLIAYDKDGNPYNVITTAYYDDGNGNITYGYLYDDQFGRKYYLVSTPGITPSIDSSKGETYASIWDENGFATGVYKCALGNEWREVSIYNANYDTRLQTP